MQKSLKLGDAYALKIFETRAFVVNICKFSHHFSPYSSVLNSRHCESHPQMKKEKSHENMRRFSWATKKENILKTDFYTNRIV